MSRRLRLCALAVLACVPLFAAADKEVIYDAKSHVVMDQVVPCIGKVYVDYWFRERVTEMSDGSGGYHFSDHLNIDNFHATDDSGTEYSGSGTANNTFHVAANGTYPVEQTSISNLTGLSHGSGPNLHIKIRYRVTINAPGQATVQRDIYSIECIPD